MQREPNPYSKNPMLTVTGTMAISVPSVVAEDVMNGEADKVISVDPAVNSRIDAVSEAVDLMDTRIDTVSEVLALNSSGSASGELPTNLVKFTGDVSLMFDLKGAGVYRATPFEGSECIYTVQALLAASGIHNTPNREVNTAARTVMTLVEGATQSSTPSIMWNSGDGKGFRTWEPWKGTESSSSGSNNGPVTTLTAINSQTHGVQFNSSDQVFINTDNGTPVRSESNRLISKPYSTYELHDHVYPYLELHGSTLRWFDGDNTNNIELASLSSGGNSGSSGSRSEEFIHGTIAYLDPVLKFEHEDSGTALDCCNNSSTYAYTGDAGVAIVLGNSDTLGSSTTCNLVYPIITPGMINAANRKCRLAWIDDGSGQWDLKYTVDDGYNWLELGGGSTTATTTSSGVSFVPRSQTYPNLIIDQSEGDYLSFVTQRDNGALLATGLAYGLQVALAAFDKPSVRLRLSGSGTSPKLQVLKGDEYAWEDFAIGGGSSSSSNTVTFGPIYGDSQQYELSLALNDGRTDYASAIVELKEPTDSYRGIAALGAYLAAPASSSYDNTDYDRGVTMAVSGMGTLVFRRNSEIIKYDLNNLGGSESGESSESTIGTPTSIATYENLNANGSISDYNVAGEFKVLLGSGRDDSASGVVTLYLEDADGDYISGVNVLLNTALTVGRSSSSGSERYLYGGIRPVISEDEQTLSWEYHALDGYKWTPVSSGGQSVTIDTALSATSENPVQNKVVHAELAKKQDVLESGTTLKTINGISLLGGGDIQIGSDGSTSTTAEFVPVQYLGNTGTQYIDTGYVLQEDDILEVDYEIPESALSIKNDKILIDARDDSYGVRVSTYSGTYKWYARFGHNESQTSAALTSSLKGSLTLSKGQFILNGSVVFNSLVFSAMPTGTLKLLAGVNYETGAISAPSYARISACKIKRNGETIRNFRPVQRTADGELGMRDAVTGEFLTNAGTGVFDYLPSDVVEAGTVVKKPTLTEEQKLALQALMDDYYNNRNTFFYEFTHNRNAFTSGGQCYDSTKGKFKQCCATFVQHIMMGRSVNDFVGKTGSTYSPNITKTAVSDFGYYFDFKYRKYLYGLTDTDENGNEVYYGYNQPNEDNFEGSYSYNSYYHPDSKNTNKQNFNGFCNANDMARELYEMGCEVPFAELDVGDIIFTLDNDLSDNSSMLNFHAWRNIYHVGMVYDVKQIDASSKEIYYIECTSYFDVDNRPIEKPFLSSSQMDLRFKAFKLTEDMAFCARMPIAFGYAPNVPSKITTSATPS